MKHYRCKWNMVLLYIFWSMEEPKVECQPIRYQTMAFRFQLSSWMGCQQALQFSSAVFISLRIMLFSVGTVCKFAHLLPAGASSVRLSHWYQPALTFRTGAQLRSAINLLSVSVCLAACQCAHVGNNCDANTGQCICPPNTVGERCDKCAPNHWGHDISSGCKVRHILLSSRRHGSACVYLSSAETSLLFILCKVMLRWIFVWGERENQHSVFIA